jgi:regulator of protease activity HflC (stomatin/prohibitin superfamily)
MTYSANLVHQATGQAMRPGRRVVVRQWESGLLFRHGQHVGTLEPGAHRRWQGGHSLLRIDTRPWILTVPLQEVPTADGIAVRISVALAVRVTEPLTFVTSSQSPIEELYLSVQVALRELAAASSIEALVDGRAQHGQQLRERISGEGVGVSVERAELKDIVVPAEIRRAQAQVLVAKAEGQAALERARSETAALRGLANAARLAAEQPTLLQLRLLQQLDASSGHTVVIGGPATVPPAG